MTNSKRKGEGKDHVLEVVGLKTYFYTDDGIVKAVDGVDFTVDRGEIFGLVGESGCGKTVTALSILQLIDEPGRIIEGVVYFEGIPLSDLSEKEMANIRGGGISMIFQEPISNLNPVFMVGDQLVEAIQIHLQLDRTEAEARAVELFIGVGIWNAEEMMHAYPHELSGGQAQRAMIAISLASEPELLIADEPTSALDVTIQAKILDLLRDLSREKGIAIILISHNLGVVAEAADRVAVMYAGQLVESAHVERLFSSPMHPYTKGLIASLPQLGGMEERLRTIPGLVPNPSDLPPGCRFAPRCDGRVQYALRICEAREPDLRAISNDHWVRCWLYQDWSSHTAPIQLP